MVIAVAAHRQTMPSSSAIEKMMALVAKTTAMRWVCIAEVTPDSWTICAVHDQLAMGWQPGDGIATQPAFMDQVQHNEVGLVTDTLRATPLYQTRVIPQQLGFASYFSLPVNRADGSFFGTLCGFDPDPVPLTTPTTLNMLHQLADLLTSQIEVAVQLKDTKQALTAEQEAAKQRERFIAVLAHDIKTPLSAMLMGAAVIGRLAQDDKILALVQRIVRSGHRIDALMNDVLDFTHGKIGGLLAVNREVTTTLSEALQHVVDELQYVYPGRRITTRFGFAGPLICDVKRVGQLLSNLVINAIVHGDQHTPIHVTANNDLHYLYLSVSNSGPAISSNTAACLFQPFWRGEQARKSPGLGLGLYIASQISQSHDGTLVVDSTPEQTVFTFIIARPDSMALALGTYTPSSTGYP